MFSYIAIVTSQVLWQFNDACLLTYVLGGVSQTLVSDKFPNKTPKLIRCGDLEGQSTPAGQICYHPLWCIIMELYSLTNLFCIQTK